jgi:hypothetical protein
MSGILRMSPRQFCWSWSRRVAAVFHRDRTETASTNHTPQMLRARFQIAPTTKHTQPSQIQDPSEPHFKYFVSTRLPENVSHVVRLLIENICLDDLFTAIADDVKARPAKSLRGRQAGKPRSSPVPIGNGYSAPAPAPLPKPISIPLARSHSRG